MKTLLILLAFVAASAIATAQTYSIDWFTIGGGGGTSTGGVFSVSGTIGQPDAGTLSGGNYSLAGGFWGLISAVQTPGAPLLSVARDPITGVVTVSWPRPADGWVLDETGALASTPASTMWSQVGFPYQTNTTQVSITVPSPVGNRFFRLRKP